MNGILNQIKIIFALLTVTTGKLIHSISKDSIGMDVTPLDKVDDVVACAESVTTILSKAGVINKIIPGTWSLEHHFQLSNNWNIVKYPLPGDIVMSATGTSKLHSKAPFRGHVGIVGDNGQIMANDSFSGLWGAYYTLATWRERYVLKGGYPMTFYRYSW